MDTTSESYAVFFALAGAASSLVLSSIGAAYGTAKSCKGIMEANAIINSQNNVDKYGTLQDSAPVCQSKDIGFKAFIPVVIAGVLAIYGLIYAVITSAQVGTPEFSSAQGYANFFGGLGVGLSCLVAGIAIGITAESGLKATARDSKMFIKTVLILIYCEALGLYGLIFGLLAQGIQF